MVFYFVAAAIFTLLYCSIIYGYYISWHKLNTYSIPVNSNVHTAITIIIPCRNEAEQLPILLQNVLNQNYPKPLIQVIIVDDHSTDTTMQVAQEWSSKLDLASITSKIVDLKNTVIIGSAYKKNAITQAIKFATGKLIITTDADCVPQNNWLFTIASFYESTQAKLIAAPVKFTDDGSFFQQFQALDFIGLIGITGASIQQGMHNMCNGANLCYEKDVFFEVNGFEDNHHISSGDDMFLMHKVAQLYPDKILFLKSNEACVVTHPKLTIQDFVNQRLRWTGKSTSYSDKRITGILVIAYLCNVSIFLSLLLSLISIQFFYLFLFQIGLKIIVEYLFLSTLSRYFKQSKLINCFFRAQVVHIIYVIVIGFLGQISTYTWKGRNIKK